MIVGQTALVVLNIEFFGAPIPTDPSYRPAAVTALLNPNANTLGKTMTLNQSDRVFVISKQFRNIVFYGGNTKAKGSMDEFRIGNSYAAVTPTTTDNRVDIRYAANYYPFGSPMPGRSFTAGLVYRYGFNGMEKDNEIKGEGNSYTTDWRIYDGRLGRWFSVDPMLDKYPSYSPFNFSGNSPILFNDPSGDDFFKNSKGRIKWNNSRAETLGKNGKWKNIGSSIAIKTESPIDKNNDIALGDGYPGNKMTNYFVIKGNYDEKGNFAGFTSSFYRKTGSTQAFGAEWEGDESAYGKNNHVDHMQQSNSGWSGGFEQHTQVNHWFESTGLYLAMGNIVDVNVIAKVTINKSGELRLGLSHGTFPSVNVDVLENVQYVKNKAGLSMITYKNVEAIYRFRQYSFMATHGKGGFIGTFYWMFGFGKKGAAEATRDSEEKNSYYDSFINKDWVQFRGFNAGK